MSFIYVGRLDELKGVRTLIDAWKVMNTDAPHLIICGTGPLEDWCLTQIKGSCLNAEMRGFVNNERVKRLIADSQALILPTLWYEGFPMTILEAYSVGVPVICSDLGNAGAVIEEGITGWKFKAANAEDLAKKVLGWSDIRDSVRDVYKKKYTADANYEELLSIYRSVSLRSSE